MQIYFGGIAQAPPGTIGAGLDGIIAKCDLAITTCTALKRFTGYGGGYMRWIITMATFQGKLIIKSGGGSVS